MIDDWERFLAPYYQTVKELKVKLRGIRKQFQDKNTHAPIEFVTGRVKPIDSILAKAELRGIAIERLEEEMQDIAGLRIMCQFVDDIYEVARLIRTRKDMRVVQERDYVTNKKASGYRSYHIVIEFPVQLVTGEKKILAEIQIRTLAMNFWATIEHSLNYKYQGVFPEDLSARLQRAAEAAYQLDEEMSSIREEIQEAQHMFSHGRNDWHRPDEESENETPVDVQKMIQDYKKWQATQNYEQPHFSGGVAPLEPPRQKVDATGDALDERTLDGDATDSGVSTTNDAATDKASDKAANKATTKPTNQTPHHLPPANIKGDDHH